MKTVFDPSSRDELISRINLLNENSIAQWGKMNVYQMLKHCTLWDEWVTGSGGKKYKRVFMGRIFGKIALKNIVKDDSPLRKSTPTIPAFVIKDQQGNMVAEKKKWTTLIESYAHFSNPGFIHAFFGAVTEEQIGYMVYKHADHHLRQFNC